MTTDQQLPESDVPSADVQPLHMDVNRSDTPCVPATSPDIEAMTDSFDENEGHLLQGPDVLIVTGMSGAGRTEALHALEDLGYYCIDNLPPSLLVQVTELVGLPLHPTRRIAVVCDVRSRGFFATLHDEVTRLAQRGVSYQMLFLDAEDKTLVNRYSSLRRRHPLARGGMGIAQAIARERELLGSIREGADVVIDTTTMRARDLRVRINREFSDRPARMGLDVSVMSFGFKYGLPTDADLVIDVRFLPNPYYDPEMRDMTGFDAPVREFVLEAPETQAFLATWRALLDVVMPGYVAEGKQHLSIAVGCTGGQHRSVCLAEATGSYLMERGYRVTVAHRELIRRMEGSAR